MNFVMFWGVKTCFYKRIFYFQVYGTSSWWIQIMINGTPRKTVVNGMFMSYLSYLIPLYGGSPEYLITALQILQNRAARLVTKSDWGTSSSSMMSQIGWLNVRQLIVSTHDIIQDKKPVHLYNQISQKFVVSVSNGIRETRRFKSTLGRQSFIPCSIRQWNSLPVDIRTESSMVMFRSKLRAWVKQNF